MDRAALALGDAAGLEGRAHAARDLGARVEDAADALQVALDGVVGDDE